MRIQYFFRIILIVLIILIPALMLQGCLPAESPETAPSVSEEPSAVDIIPPVSSTQVAVPARGRFTMRYDPNSALNPITSLSSDNILLSSLIYESLFILDSSLNVKPLLCESWSTEDDYTYTFVLKRDIAMSDGSRLTADDVAYSLRQAMQRGRFTNRLKNIKSIVSDGDLTVSIVLNSRNSRLVHLLDVPIIKAGSIDADIPPGTGPFVMSATQPMRLDSFSRRSPPSGL